MFIPLILIIIGAVFLLQNLGIITSDIWEIIWPSLIIVLGLSMLSKKTHVHKMKCCGSTFNCGDFFSGEKNNEENG